MRYIKAFEKFDKKYNIGDYVVADRDLYSFGEVTLTKDKPYKIIDMDDDINMMILINNSNNKVAMNDFDDRFKKIPKEEAEFILAQIKYNL